MQRKQIFCKINKSLTIIALCFFTTLLFSKNVFAQELNDSTGYYVNVQTANGRIQGEPPFFETYESAVSYLRNAMVNREEEISICISRSLYGQIESSPMTLYTAAIAYHENSSGQEGDALKYNIRAYHASWRVSSQVAITYTIQYYTTAQQEYMLTTAVNEVMRQLALGSADDYVKVLAIHDYICEHVNYNYAYENVNPGESGNYTPYTAYAALCEGKSVCQGYAQLFYRMCREAGLSVRVISGTGNGGRHAWNIVKIGDSYYNMDVTWDGQDDAVYHTYFLRGTSDFPDHIASSEYRTEEFNRKYPIANSAFVYEPGKLPVPTIVYTGAGEPYADVFHADYYYNNYADVAAVIGNNETSLVNHFVNSGMAEGRVASAEFDINIYKANYPDLVAAFGNDNKNYYLHYIGGGKAEGRTASEVIGNAGTPSAAQGLSMEECAPVFNAEYYYNTYSDLAAVFGNDAEALFAHFVLGGMAEGRVASAEFDINVYKANYPDLVAAFGEDNKSYYLHYIGGGKAEGRTAFRN